MTGSIGSAFVLPAEAENVMAPGVSLTFTSTHTITDADVALSVVNNNITAVGTAPGGDNATKTVVESWTPADVADAS